MLRTGLNLHLALNWVVINSFGSNLDPVLRTAWPPVHMFFPSMLIPSYTGGRGEKVTFLGTDLGMNLLAFFYLLQINLIYSHPPRVGSYKKRKKKKRSAQEKTQRSTRRKKKQHSKTKNMKKYRNARSLQHVMGSNVYEVSKGKIK